AAKRMQRHRAKGGAHVGLTAERYQHGRLKSGETMTAGQAVAIETHQRWVDAYAERGQLTDRQWTAADRLWQSWYSSGIQKPCTGAYDGGGSGGKSRKFGMKPSSEAPRSEPYYDAWRGLDRLPVDERTVVRAVVLFDESATAARWNARLTTHGISLLRYGLDRLADAFGLPREAI
ncbi:MAG: hypothetical protein U5L06_00575, partial [Rhodovibrio sp.]|nr:hypothetical protein [Rhodovibrio sp.]